MSGSLWFTADTTTLCGNFASNIGIRVRINIALIWEYRKRQNHLINRYGSTVEIALINIIASLIIYVSCRRRYNYVEHILLYEESFVSLYKPAVL